MSKPIRPMWYLWLLWNLRGIPGSFLLEASLCGYQRASKSLVGDWWAVWRGHRICPGKIGGNLWVLTKNIGNDSGMLGYHPGELRIHELNLWHRGDLVHWNGIKCLPDHRRYLRKAWQCVWLNIRTNAEHKRSNFLEFKHHELLREWERL